MHICKPAVDCEGVKIEWFIALAGVRMTHKHMHWCGAQATHVSFYIVFARFSLSIEIAYIYS